MSTGGQIVAVMGASKCGKTSYVRAELARMKAPRLMVWDTLDQYGDQAARVDTLGALVTAATGRTFKVRYVPQGDPEKMAERFGVFCAIAYDAGDLVMVVEELQLVTKPSWAPPDWANCTLRGMHHRELVIYGISQRPALVDKNFFGNATHAWCGRLNFADDCNTMARLLNVEPSAIGALAQLEFVSRNMETGERAHGRITFKKNRPVITSESF